MRRAGPLAALAWLAGCGEEPAAPPPPKADAAPMEAPLPTEPPPAPSTATGALPTPELDGAGTAIGAWRIEDGTAIFGGDARDSRFTLACDRSARRIALTRSAAPDDAANLRLVTPSAAVTLPVRVEAGSARATIGSDDSFVRALADEQGRLGIRIDDGETLAVKVEPALRRMLADCRRPG